MSKWSSLQEFGSDYEPEEEKPAEKAEKKVAGSVRAADGKLYIVRHGISIDSPKLRVEPGEYLPKDIPAEKIADLLATKVNGIAVIEEV